MGQMWVGFYILWCCFMVVLFNSPVSCNSPRRSGPPEDGILRQNFVKGSTNVETEKLIRATETSLRVGKGIGSVVKSNVRSGIRSNNPIELGVRQVGLVQGRLLGENVTRTESRDGSVNAARRRKRAGTDRIDKTYVKQSPQKGKGVQNYNNKKELRGRRSNRAQDPPKSQEEQSKVSQAQVGLNREKQENEISAMPENRMNPSEAEEESKGDELKTRVKVTRSVPKSIPKSESIEEEENSNSAFELTKEDEDSQEEYQRKGLQNGVKGKRAASKPFNKFVREEEVEGPKAAIQDNKEKNIGGDGGEEYDRKGLQNGVKGKGLVSKLSPKDVKEEEENQIAAVQENAERNSGGASEEELKRKGLQHEVTGKKPVSNLIHKDEIEEQDENTEVAIQENKEKNNDRDSEEEYRRKGSQNKIKGKRPVFKSIHKDEKEEEEEDPNASSQEKTNGGDSEEQNKKRGLENERKGKRRASKSSHKDEKEGNLDDLMPKSKEKEETSDIVDSEEDPNASSQEKTSGGDSKEENKKKGLENDGKGKRQVSKSTHKEEKEGNLDAPMLKSTEKENTIEIVNNEDSKRMEFQARLEGDDSELLATGKHEKKVYDDGLELAEEILTPEDISALENLAKIKEYENAKEEMRKKNQDREADQPILDQTVSNKQTKMDNRRGKGMPTQMPKVVSATADESDKREIEEDDIKLRTTSKISETEEDSADESSKEDKTNGSADNDMEEDNVSETVVTKKQLDSVLPNPEEENVDETEDNDVEEANASKRVPTKKQSKSNFSNFEEQNADEAEDNDVEEDASKRVPTKKQFKSSFSNQEEKNADESEDNDIKEGTAAKRVPPKKQSKLKFSNPEEESVDESADDHAKVENESETVPNNKQPRFNFSNPEEENPDEFEVSDVNEDDEIKTLPTNKQSKSKLTNPREDNADEDVGNDIKEDDISEAVPKHRQSKSDVSLQEQDNVGESVNDDAQSEAESETILDDKHSNSVDSEESSANSTNSVEVDEEAYSDFIQEIQDLPSKFQDTAGKVADKLMPEIEKFSNKSKHYFNRANEGITEGFRPLIGNKYAPFFASMISYILVLLPLIVVIVLFDKIRTYFPLQKAILYANIYLAAYFATLLLASFLIGMEPMVFFFRNSLTGYIYLQLLEALGYIIYLILQLLNLIISFSKGPVSAKLAAFLQCGVSIFIGLHYYITIFHRAMAQKAPHTSWMVYGAYTIIFFVLCLFSNTKYGKKEYIQEQYGNTTSKKN
ncbi:uncharacterized protein LOC131040802 isoform X2 [Cryptomeria japonica]|nr:uncharacterized protein LOC131040802 isoform X2 [Cryptomeria japonica]